MWSEGFPPLQKFDLKYLSKYFTFFLAFMAAITTKLYLLITKKNQLILLGNCWDICNWDESINLSDSSIEEFLFLSSFIVVIDLSKAMTCLHFHFHSFIYSKY